MLSKHLVRPRNNGRTFELRVEHCRLPKPACRNFDLQEDAQLAGRDAIVALDRGEIPSWFERSGRRALASVTHGYTRVCTGTVPPERLSTLAAKFDQHYRIANIKGQRVVNKRAGRANTLVVAYAPPDEYRVDKERLP